MKMELLFSPHLFGQWHLEIQVNDHLSIAIDAKLNPTLESKLLSEYRES